MGAWFVFFVFHEGVNHIVFIKLIYAFMVLCQIDKNQSEVVEQDWFFLVIADQTFQKNKHIISARLVLDSS